MNQQERFNKWLNWLFKWEGTVYEDDPSDKGGETKFGVDKRSHPNEDIRNLTRDRAAEIYWNEYWTKCKAHLMPFGVGEVVANIAVNAGHSRAAKWLQAIVGVDQDGSIGNKTLEALGRFQADLVATLLLQRTEQHYRSIAKGRMAKFLRGWINRNDDLRKFIHP
jgi:hypothetical protein